ncbi:hypothetical protein [Piscinibacter sp. XHJ-5]|uniref:hypothetical protein n=1 Tax=Piscinibacter sp. XHJ-5 TaxID=3037797 RepID=UPI0024530BCD|nr:hypothetical protein [Piscinibacter sp. XHJ-5]
MKTIAAALAACIAAGCATQQRSEPVTVVRTRPPANVQETVSSYFDLTMAGPQHNRKLAIGSPEASDCALRGSGGYHKGWMVPVIYDTSPPPAASAAPARTSAAGTGSAKGSSAKGAATRAVAPAVTTSTAPTVTGDDGITTATLREVQISGKGYFFWFSNDTIAGVSRRADGCP